MGEKLIIMTVVAAVALAACGSDDSSDAEDEARSAVSAAQDAVEDALDDAQEAVEDAVEDAQTAASDLQDDIEELVDDAQEAADDAVEQAEEIAENAGAGSGSATLTLDNGETYEFSILCVLEPQMAAGSEILFTAVSYDDPGLDITQFGDEGTVTGVASVSVYDGEFNTLWDSGSIYPEPIELTLDGSTITGTGTFYEGGELSGTAVPGEIVADC